MHPLQILVRDHQALLDWAAGKPGPRTAQVVGALGELIVSTHRGAKVVSHDFSSHDLLDGGVKVEVKTASGSSLSGKDCTEVAWVTLRRTAEGGVFADMIEYRPHPDPGDGINRWVPDSTFIPYQVL